VVATVDAAMDDMRDLPPRPPAFGGAPRIRKILRVRASSRRYLNRLGIAAGMRLKTLVT
jgi:hypothetical protein